MKKIVYSLLSGLALLGLAGPVARAQQMPARRQCATMDVLAAQLATDPGYGARLQALDQQAAAYAAKKAANPAQRTS